MDNKLYNENKPQIEEEINFLNVIKTPSRWFGLIYPYFLAVIFIAGYYYVININQAQINTSPYVIADSANIFKDVKATKGSISKGIDIKEIAKPSEVSINKGKALFLTNCISCHGVAGMGDGPAGAMLNPKPRNFHALEGWKNGRKFSDMFRTVQKGIPGSAMPAFEYIPNEDKVALIGFVRTFRTDFPQTNEQELAEMDKAYNLSKGTVTPAQIPVSQAVELQSSDISSEVKLVNNAFIFTKLNENDPGGKIFEAVAGDKLKALTFLSKSNAWQESPSELIKTVSVSLIVNGFKPDVINLSQSRLNDLFSFLKRAKISKG
ncbi:MAG: cytochrome c [Ignavibacteria bacterium]